MLIIFNYARCLIRLIDINLRCSIHILPLIKPDLRISKWHRRSNHGEWDATFPNLEGPPSPLHYKYFPLIITGFLPVSIRRIWVAILLVVSRMAHHLTAALAFFGMYLSTIVLANFYPVASLRVLPYCLVFHFPIQLPSFFFLLSSSFFLLPPPTSHLILCHHSTSSCHHALMSPCPYVVMPLCRHGFMPSCVCGHGGTTHVC